MTALEKWRRAYRIPKHECPMDREMDFFKKAIQKAKQLVSFTFSTECKVCEEGYRITGRQAP